MGGGHAHPQKGWTPTLPPKIEVGVFHARYYLDEVACCLLRVDTLNKDHAEGRSRLPTTISALDSQPPTSCCARLDTAPKDLEHPNIVRLLGATWRGPRLMMIVSNWNLLFLSPPHPFPFSAGSLQCVVHSSA